MRKSVSVGILISNKSANFLASACLTSRYSLCKSTGNKLSGAALKPFCIETNDLESVSNSGRPRRSSFSNVSNDDSVDKKFLKERLPSLVIELIEILW